MANWYDGEVRLIRLLLVLCLLLLGVILLLTVQAKPVVVKPDEVSVDGKLVAFEAVVSRVVDGDTIEISSGEKVRYIGINTPESVDKRKGVQCFGIEASGYNKKLVDGVKIWLEKDVSDKDMYGRLLRYVYLDDPTMMENPRMVNEILVKDGYAAAYTFPPDVKYRDRFLTAQKEAREAKRGLWKICPVKFR